MPGFADVDQYVASLPPDVAERLCAVRDLVHELVPDAGEKISYGIPTFTLSGKSFVHVGGWKKHLSLYPVPPGDDALMADLEPYVAGKGTLKFPFSQPLPVPLISRVVEALARR